MNNINNKRKESSSIQGDDDIEQPLYKCQRCGHDVPTANRTVHNLTYHKTDNDETVSNNSSNNDTNTNNDAQDEREEQTVEDMTTTSMEATATTTSIEPTTTMQEAQQQLVTDEGEGAVHQSVEVTEVAASMSSTNASLNSTSNDGNNTSSSEQQHQWSCPRCTLLNDNTLSQCEACLYNRQSQLSSSTTQQQQQQHPRVFTTHELMQQQQQPPLSSQMPRATIRTEVRQVDTQLVGSVFNVLSWAAIGGAIGGPVGALVGAATGGVIDATTRFNNNRIAARHGNNNRDARRMMVISTTSLTSPTVEGRQRQQGSTNNTPIASIGRHGNMQIIFTAPPGEATNGANDAERAIIRMLLLSAMSQQNNATGEDVTQLSYEELLQRFGIGVNQSRGASQEVIDSLPVTKYNDDNSKDDTLIKSENEKICNICLEEYKNGDEIKKLQPYCTHGFHKGCIDQWLRRVSSCPICKKDINIVQQQQREVPTSPVERTATATESQSTTTTTTTAAGTNISADRQ